MPVPDIQKIFSISSENDFNTIAIEIFQYQYQKNKIYQTFVNHLFKNNTNKIEQIKHYTEIPFIPIELFKQHKVTCFDVKPNTAYFESSGTTTKNLSKHYIYDESLYQTSILQSFQRFYGTPNDYLFIFLLPSENERPHSSLIYMAKYLKTFSKFKESDFYLNKMNDAKNLIKKYLTTNTKIFILGLSYALLDFCEYSIPLNAHTIVMETGGMKGKRTEIPKQELHQYLSKKLGIKHIHSEYGMTELFSQAYAYKNGIFFTPPWMKVLIRDTDDPLSIYTKNKQGIINIIDLANLHTCSYIATADIGRIYENGNFEIIGRSDFSDIRGCNLMYQ